MMATTTNRTAGSVHEFDGSALVEHQHVRNHDDDGIQHQKTLLQAFKRTPLLLKWGEDDTDEIQLSLIHGWKSLLCPVGRTNIRLDDDGGTKLSVILEILPSISALSLLLPCWSKLFSGNVVAHGFFFTRDATTGQVVDLVHRVKLFSGTEAKRTYKDIQSFDAGTKRILVKGAMVEKSVFLLTTGFHHKCLQVDANFKQPSFQGFSSVIDRVNSFIMNDDRVTGRRTSKGVYPVLNVDTDARMEPEGLVGATECLGTILESNGCVVSLSDQGPGPGLGPRPGPGPGLGMCQGPGLGPGGGGCGSEVSEEYTFVDTDMVRIQPPQPPPGVNTYVGVGASSSSGGTGTGTGRGSGRGGNSSDGMWYPSDFKDNQCFCSDPEGVAGVVEAVCVDRVVVVHATMTA